MSILIYRKLGIVICQLHYYNSIVKKKINRRKKSENLIDIGTNLVSDIFGAVTKFALLGTSLSLLKVGHKYARGIPLIKSITKKVEEAIYKNPDAANIHYLTKINRVAKLKPRSLWGRLF